MEIGYSIGGVKMNERDIENIERAEFNAEEEATYAYLERLEEEIELNDNLKRTQKDKV